MKILEKSEAIVPTKYGKFRVVVYQFENEKKEHIAIFNGDVANQENVFLRIHSECFTGDVFGSLKCDCGDQLEFAIQSISSLEKGVILYLRQEGRGIGLLNKMKAYSLQDKEGYDTYVANEKIGLPPDARDYTVASEMIKDLKIASIEINTNNPEKVNQLKKKGIKVNKIIPSVMPTNDHNQNYLKTKKEKFNHFL